ncbi:MAG: TetR/AcrR family transcriptional regulator, partial [Eubacterium sp.]|nr:TetR/AcrR family transcriptional regulator [Eubacterium sp.]
MLKTACRDLIEKKQLAKITVNELCEKAGVNRSTFYRYYTDIYDLWAEIEEDCFIDLISRINLPDARDPKVFFSDLFDAIKANQILTPTALQHADSSLLIPKIMEHYKKVAFLIWQTNQ